MQMLKFKIGRIPVEAVHPGVVCLSSKTRYIRPTFAVAQDKVLLIVVCPCHVPVITGAC